MQEQNVDQSLKSRLNQRQPRKVSLGLLGIALLPPLALGSAVVIHAVMTPLVPNRMEGVTARLGCYFHKGQWKADARTLAAAFQYLTTAEH